VRIIVGLVAVLLLAAGAFIVRTLVVFNHFDEIERSFDGLCEPVAGIVGPEDLQVSADGRTVFISSHDRIAHAAGEATRGGVYAFDLDNPLAARSWVDRTGGAPADFLPHGIHVYEEGGLRRLFAVNMKTSSVEIFDIDDDEMLTHVESVTDPRITSPNDVVATGPRSFYVTNDVEAGRDSDIGTLHALLRKPRGSILRFDDGRWSRAAEGLRFANGVVLDAAGERLLVAEASGFAVKVYDRSADGSLSFNREIPLGTAVDNINRDEDGAFWIGAHPKPLDLLPHEKDVSTPSPSEVLKLTLGEAAAGDRVEAVYLDDGRELSGSTSAARSGDHLLIGALYEQKFLLCRMGATTPAF